MYQKFALFALDPFSSDIKKRENGFFTTLGLTTCTLIDSEMEWNDPKLLIKEIGVGEKLSSDHNQMVSFLNSEKSKNPTWNTLITHLSKQKVAVHIIIPLLQVNQYLPLIAESLSSSQIIILHLTISKLPFKPLLKEAKELESFVKNYENISFGTLMGEMSIFNQENNRQEIQKCYDEIVFDQTQTSFTLPEYLEKQQEKEIPPEKITPVSFVEAESFENGDVMMIVEPDNEKIQFITQTFEVSKNEKKKSDFDTFNPIFITKNLGKSLIITPKKPYDTYENLSLFENKVTETLPNLLAKNELRQLHLADHQHFPLITKYLNNEAGFLYDGQKNKESSSLIAEDGTCIQTANETLIKTYKQEINHFEAFFLAGSFSEDENPLLKQFISFSQENKVRILILDFQEKKIWYSSEIGTGEKTMTIGKFTTFLKKPLEYN